MKALFFLMVLATTISSVIAQNNQDVSMFPQPKEGYKKIIIALPEKKNENNLKLEFTVGKNVEVDKCNKHFLMGEIKEKNLDGWGYNYYEFTSKGDIAGTKMGCPTDEKVTKFITGEQLIVRYNSKLPVVIYVPENTEVKYRIWKAKDKWMDGNK